MRTLMVVVGMLAVAFAGCTEGIPAAADVVGQGQWGKGTLKDVDFPCDGNARFDAGAQGQGHLVITLRDALGSAKATLTVNGQSQEGMDKEVTGEPGEWNLRVEVRDYNWPYQNYGGYDPYQGIDFQGQYGAVVFCDAP